MTKSIERQALNRILELVDAIMDSQGWQEALASDDPGNVTVWIGPRLWEIRDTARYPAARVPEAENGQEWDGTCDRGGRLPTAENFRGDRDG